MAPSKTQRWLDILAVLIGNRYPISVDQLMAGVPAYAERWIEGDETDRKSVRRMFERDKDELRRLGIPLVVRPVLRDGQPIDGYCIAKRDFYLPYLHLVAGSEDLDEHPESVETPAIGAVTLSESEATLAIRALREVIRLPSFPFVTEARTALSKLTFDLDAALTSAVAGDHETLRVLDRPGGADPDGSLGTLLDGVYDRRCITFRYHSIGRDVEEVRRVEPWGLLFQWGSWYLIGRDLPTESGDSDDPNPDLRMFRLDRMTEARPLRTAVTRPEFEVPQSFDLNAYGSRDAWELGADAAEQVEVQVRFHPPASRLAARNGWGELVEDLEDGGAVRSFGVTRLDPLVRWVLAHAGEAEVISPPQAVDRVRSMARGILARYEEPAS